MRKGNEERILITAPSDAACDVLTLRIAASLSELNARRRSEGDKPTVLLRFNNFQRKLESLPVQLLSHSNLEDGRFKLLSTLGDADIVVCTCVCSAFLPWGDLDRGRLFTHAFVDESCQATEGEILIPLSNVGVDCSVILGGDPRQLGPQIYDPECASSGLTISLLERLRTLPLYESVEYAIATTLSNNYRSHPALLDVPSSLFYNKALLPCARSEVTDSALNWEDLHNSSFPLLFYDAADGEGVCEVDMPSFFNKRECDVVVDFVRRLVESKEVEIGTKVRRGEL